MAAEFFKNEIRMNQFFIFFCNFLCEIIAPILTRKLFIFSKDIFWLMLDMMFGWATTEATHTQKLIVA